MVITSYVYIAFQGELFKPQLSIVFFRTDTSQGVLLLLWLLLQVS